MTPERKIYKRFPDGTVFASIDWKPGKKWYVGRTDEAGDIPCPCTGYGRWYTRKREALAAIPKEVQHDH